MRVLWMLVAVAVFLQACSDTGNTASTSEAAAKALATKDSSQPAAVALSEAVAGSYELDKTHGYVTFSYSHQGYSRPWLRFRDVDAVLELDPSQASNSKLEVSIDSSSIDSGVDIFDTHLRGEQFFNVAAHPKITFVASGVRESAVSGEFFIDGILTMKGISKPLVLDARFNKSGLHFKTKKPHLGFSASAQLKRSDWDLGYAVPMVGDDVEILIEAEFMHR